MARPKAKAALAENARVRKLNRELRECKGKVAHATRDDALKANTRSFKTKGVSFKVYRCPSCKKWHLGKGHR